MADDDERGAGQRETFYVPPGRGEVDFVPDGRNRKFQVGVVGEERLSRGGVVAADDPIVTAEAVADLAGGILEVAEDRTRQRRC